ncbi:MAG: ABC transporter ATP-binding protein [Candidatus Falkowbacteria bacterium]|nr:ABC transporter ATP-binding protein [Candidatus Falkowbacteria bacterium]
MDNQDNSEKTEDTLPWSRFWVELWKLLSNFHRSAFILLGIATFTAGLDLVQPYILKFVVDGLTNFSRAELTHILWLIAYYLLANETRSLIQYVGDRKILRFLVDIEYFLAIKAQQKLTYLSLGYHEKENTGAKMVKIERGIDRISQFIGNTLWEITPTIIQLIFTAIILFLNDWRIGSSFLVFAPLFIFLTYWSNKKMYPVRKKLYRDYEMASGKTAQSIININAVQSFVQEKRELKEIDKIKTRIRDNDNLQYGWMMKIGLYRNAIVDFGRATVLFLGVYFVSTGELSIGSLIFVFTLSEKAYGSLYRLSRFYDKMEEGREGISRLIKLFNTPREIANKSNAIKPKRIHGELEFKNVSFFYSENSSPAINDLTCKIPAGGVTALVGPSGGGKTTIARLVYRHYDPQKGEVLLDGKNLKDYDLYSFRKFFAIVPQEVEIFDLSIRENISYAKPGASLQEIQAAARIANAEEFIEKLDKKYDTMVGERGIKLSGGQRQRVGIARAILANPKVLIFDEATSSLDSYSEKLIQDAMDKISKGRTMIIIAHRLSTIKKADKILVLENGCLAESGSHHELARINGGLYAKLIKLQELGEVR